MNDSTKKWQEREISPQQNMELPDLSGLTRVLIIRLSSIGDVVHALPVSAAIGEAYPHLELTWLVEDMSAEVVQGNPYLKDVIVVPRTRWKREKLTAFQRLKEGAELFANLRQRRFDLTLDLQGHAKSGLYALATGAKYRYGWRRLRDGANLVSRRLPARPESIHRVDWYLDTIRAFGVSCESIQFPLFIPDVAQARIKSLLEQNGFTGEKPYVVLNPAVGDYTRRWSVENYAHLLTLLEQELGLPSVLVGSGKDVEVCEAVLREAARMRSERTPPQFSPSQGEGDVSSRFNGEGGGEGRERSSQRNSQRECPPPFSLAGQTNLKELAALLQGCTVHVCGDTGSAHIGAAVNAPVIGLYGPSDAAHAGPWGQADNVLEHRELCQNECSVRQCVLAPGASSGIEMARCLAEIKPEQVLDAVRRVTKQSHDR